MGKDVHKGSAEKADGENLAKIAHGCVERDSYDLALRRQVALSIHWLDYRKDHDSNESRVCKSLCDEEGHDAPQNDEECFMDCVVRKEPQPLKKVCQNRAHDKSYENRIAEGWNELRY